MSETIRIELPEETKAALDEAVREEGVSANNFVAKALKDYLFIRRFRSLRERMLSKTTEPLTDQDVFDRVS
jgi:metal-responsive CopG/Arc/MetJ family transcriptional regulator